MLTNAVKFTHRGGDIHVLLERVNSHLEISVTDTGQGISPEFLPHMFERFRQADASAARRHGGLGLGLSIVKQITEMHGGVVSARSAGLNQGATFTIELPILAVHPSRSKPNHSRAGAEAAAVQWIELSGLKLLVVDDEADARELIRRLLVECGADVETAESAQTALASIQNHRPNLVISDMGCPGLMATSFCVERANCLKETCQRSH